MRILQVYKDIHPFVRGGIERYIHDLSSHLSGMGHEVTVLVAGSGGSSEKVSGFNVIEYPCMCRILSNPISPRLCRILKTIPADILHFHLPLPSAVAAWMLSRRDTPYVVTYHSDIVRQAFLLPLYGPLLRKFLKGAFRVIATSPVYRETSIYLSDLENIDVIPIGSDLDVFRPPDTVQKGEYVLFVGRFRMYKGIEVLLDAWNEFPERRLLMVGGGPLENKVRRRILEENLNIEVVSNPSDQELIELYQQASCLVLPSTLRSEAFGMVQTEAMACGIPVISTALPTGVPWVNADSVSGLVIPPGDPAALAAAVRELDDPHLHSFLAAGALERVERSFNAAKLFTRVESLLEEAANAKTT
ncbi:MAG: glycosyltransferase [Candidatus Aegiribacteria sp.]|nr:glycosyltransferase [Candidatus Aegiribacteria sp.]